MSMQSGAAIKELLNLRVGGVCGMRLYMPYIRVSTVKDIEQRGRRFLAFLRWASTLQDFQWDYRVLALYSDYLKSLGNAQSTIAEKVSNIRQFLKAAENDDVIPQCVYYAKRGRKPKSSSSTLPALCPVESRVVVGTPQISVSKGFRKTFLYDMFGLGKVFSYDYMKRSYRKLATVFHPDHENGSKERFIACREAYDFLSDNGHRLSYDLYINNRTTPQDVVSFVHSVYQRFGGYSTLRSCSL